ncbi:hypothetical protein I3843_13G027200 [Carya illinoinensis]|nr:hypothetical protein I3843_13G027200 [Carya illinoinensis]
MPRRKIIYAGLGCQALYSLKKSGKFCHGLQSFHCLH